MTMHIPAPFATAGGRMLEYYNLKGIMLLFLLRC